MALALILSCLCFCVVVTDWCRRASTDGFGFLDGGALFGQLSFSSPLVKLVVVSFLWLCFDTTTCSSCISLRDGDDIEAQGVYSVVEHGRHGASRRACEKFEWFRSSPSSMVCPSKVLAGRKAFSRRFGEA